MSFFGIHSSSGSKDGRTPRWWAILVPFTVLVCLQSWLVATYGSGALDGASQVCLLLTAGLVWTMGHFLYHRPWSAFGEEIDANIGRIGSAMIILLMIGMLSATWMVSGVIPTLICYGLKIISPKIFLFTACIISALIALMTGSSWTTIATVGVALVGIGDALGFSPGMTAGAIISGAYFGDKMSPLSDTTVLASSSAGTDLFPHIRYMMVTTIPSISIALLAFLLISVFHPVEEAVGAELFSDTLQQSFVISPWLLIVPILTGVLIARRVPAIPTLLCGALLGAVAALIFQPHVLCHISSGEPLSSFSEMSQVPHSVMFQGLVDSVYGATSIQTGNEAVNALVATRGMAGMLNTIFLIISAACFGASLIASGMLSAFADRLIKSLRRRTSVVAGTLTMGMFSNLITGDQFLSIMLTCNIFRPVYRRAGYQSRLLSRSAEDSATVTSVLIPWNSCGMTQAMVLGVATMAYLPFCFFNILSPLSSLVVAALGYRIPPASPVVEDAGSGDEISSDEAV